jgi:hypothetical protein
LVLDREETQVDHLVISSHPMLHPDDDDDDDDDYIDYDLVLDILDVVTDCNDPKPNSFLESLTTTNLLSY